MFTITQKQLDAIEAHGEATYPHECCGFIFGKRNQAGEVISVELRQAENQRKDRGHDRFEIAPKDYMQAERYADNNGLAIVGFYHSHPDSPAVPSQFDVDHAWPSLVYTITEVRKGKAQVTYAHTLSEDRTSLNKIDMTIKE